jgi:aspartyl-tRNA(Asn)/glutamyl-tRNA(Gln) amidotransferase subunit C
VAALASLELDGAELELFARQLAAILAYAEEVQRVDTTGIPATAAVRLRHGAARADYVRPSLTRSLVLEQAPDAAVDAGFFKVPRVIG